MTHKDIYTKFMIEYDKADVTSSYPSLTEYEVATILDKAYNALIAQKVTGNNIRKAVFESDIKSIADLSPLVVSDNGSLLQSEDILNGLMLDLNTLSPDMLYFISASIKQDAKETPMYGKKEDRNISVKLVSHHMAEKFFATPYNLPWIKIPVCYIENNYLYVIVDPINSPKSDLIRVVYIKKPVPFVSNDLFSNSTEFECNETFAEELISLAITFALENVESQRLTSKLNTRGLEA